MPSCEVFEAVRVLWLRPSTGENISVRRERIAEELRERGYEIDIRNASGLDGLGAIKQALTGEYDVIAGNVRVGLYLGFPLAKVLRTPFLGDVSDPLSDIDYLAAPLFRFFEWYEWFVLKRADAAVFVYGSSYEAALERGIDDAVKLPNAVNYEQFATPEPEALKRAADLLQAEGVDLDKPIAIYIGIFSPRYCIEELLATASHTPEWEFVFVGEGGLKDRVAETARNRENVHYPGAFPYQLMPGFLDHADVGFCFKDAEQPLKLKEYGAAGLPIVVRPGELSTWYDEDELVFVDPDPEAIAGRLNELRNDKKLYERYSKAGRTIASEWSWEAIADGYDELFQSIGKQ